MPRTRDILACIDFPESERANLTFSDETKLRLDPADHDLKLLADSSGKFSTDADLYIKTQQLYPKTGRAWDGFYVDATIPTDTSLGYKLNDGTDDYYWDGGSWSVAGASNWNTEAEIATNIPTYDKRKISVLINFVTTDDTATPEVNSIYIGYQARVVFLEQWIYRTLVPLLRNNVRPLASWPIPIGSDTTTIDLNNYSLDTPFNLTDVDAVFNHTDDSDHLTDIFSSYNPGTKIITLSTQIDAGKVAWIEFEYEPEVAALTSVDYHEIEKVPAITIENLRVGEAMRSGEYNYLVNKADHTKAYKYEPPWLCCLKGDIIVQAPRSLDEMALAEEVISYVSENQTITIEATGEKVDWFILGGAGNFYSRNGVSELSDLKSARIAFEMRWLRAWLRPKKGSSAGIYSIKSLQLTGDVDVVL